MWTTIPCVIWWKKKIRSLKMIVNFVHACWSCHHNYNQFYELKENFDVNVSHAETCQVKQCYIKQAHQEFTQWKVGSMPLD